MSEPLLWVALTVEEANHIFALYDQVPISGARSKQIAANNQLKITQAAQQAAATQEAAQASASQDASDPVTPDPTPSD